VGPEAGEGGVDEVGEDGLRKRKVEDEGKEGGEVGVEGSGADGRREARGERRR
jgi:hypothetical protein